MVVLVRIVAVLVLVFSSSSVYAKQRGVASYYKHGVRTASGERFNKHAMTAAHRTLPFGTMVRVDCAATGRAVTVRINDRGPFVRGRIIDLSQGAAQALGITQRGAAPVELTLVH